MWRGCYVLRGSYIFIDATGRAESGVHPITCITYLLNRARER
jgi:hypothetical protein